MATSNPSKTSWGFPRGSLLLPPVCRPPTRQSIAGFVLSLLPSVMVSCRPLAAATSHYIRPVPIESHVEGVRFGRRREPEGRSTEVTEKSAGGPVRESGREDSASSHSFVRRRSDHGWVMEELGPTASGVGPTAPCDRVKVSRGWFGIKSSQRR